MERKMKRLLAIFLTATMILTSNASVFAAEEIGAASAAAVSAGAASGSMTGAASTTMRISSSGSG